MPAGVVISGEILTELDLFAVRDDIRGNAGFVDQATPYGLASSPIVGQDDPPYCSLLAFGRNGVYIAPWHKGQLL